MTEDNIMQYRISVECVSHSNLGLSAARTVDVASVEGAELVSALNQACLEILPRENSLRREGHLPVTPSTSVDAPADEGKPIEGASNPEEPVDAPADE